MNIQGLKASSSEAEELLKALANSNRLMILCELKDGERSVSALERVVPLAQSALSQHLAKLRECGIVTTRREAQTIFYSLSDARVSRLMDALHEVFCTPAKRKSRRYST
jgi:DNA-binding transcriptional ArsR family regulator